MDIRNINEQVPQVEETEAPGTTGNVCSWDRAILWV